MSTMHYWRNNMRRIVVYVCMCNVPRIITLHYNIRDDPIILADANHFWRTKSNCEKWMEQFEQDSPLVQYGWRTHRQYRHCDFRAIEYRMRNQERCKWCDWWHCASVLNCDGNNLIALDTLSSANLIVIMISRGLSLLKIVHRSNQSKTAATNLRSVRLSHSG